VFSGGYQKSEKKVPNGVASLNGIGHLLGVATD
jgi:hypothetical protein